MCENDIVIMITECGIIIKSKYSSNISIFDFTKNKICTPKANDEILITCINNKSNIAVKEHIEDNND